MVSQWNSSGISSQDLPYCISAPKSKSYCQKWANSQKNSQDGSSSCRCSTTFHGDLKTMKQNANQALSSFLSMRKDSHQDNSHSSDLDQTRSGILLTNTIHKENGTELQNWWWSNSVKADTQFSAPRVHCPGECSRAKVVENCQYTSVPMGRQLKIFFRTMFSVIQLSITEQSQICVKNLIPAMSEQGDLLWQDNLTHCSCQVWWRHTYFWPVILHKKKIYCKDTRNEMKSYHNKTEWANSVLMQDSWPQLKSDSTSWEKTLKNFHNSQLQWPVVSALCQETKIHLTQKVGFEGTLRFDPYWKSQPATFKVNMEWKLE